MKVFKEFGLKSAAVDTTAYFAQFSYAPSFEEVFTFFPRQITRQNLQILLKKLVKAKVLSEQSGRYTLVQYTNYIKVSNIKAQISKRKIYKLRFFVHCLTQCRSIELVGLSGSVAMSNAKKDDDIDLFIITTAQRVFTGRFFASLTATLLGRLRRRNDTNLADKICLNLFFDEKNLRVPRVKQTAYVAHEILQMKPVLNKNNAHERFLEANRWVYGFFPNTRINVKLRTQSSKLQRKSKSFSLYAVALHSPLFALRFLGNVLEHFLKRLQLISIKKHQTSEIITDTQLWFFPDDFEKKLQPPGKTR